MQHQQSDYFQVVEGLDVPDCQVQGREAAGVLAVQVNSPSQQKRNGVVGFEDAGPVEGLGVLSVLRVQTDPVDSREVSQRVRSISLRSQMKHVDVLMATSVGVGSRVNEHQNHVLVPMVRSEVQRSEPRVLRLVQVGLAPADGGSTAPANQAIRNARVLPVQLNRDLVDPLFEQLPSVHGLVQHGFALALGTAVLLAGVGGGGVRGEDVGDE